MTVWAQSQGIGGDNLKILTDTSSAGQEVRAHEIVDAISGLASKGTVEQLIIYFSGHGIHNKGDYWLLSRAPTAPTEAVNVEGSLYFARYCGIPHVVIISDACRTAPAGIQALSVTGLEIFPNDPSVNGKQGAVDLFFACSRGKPSLEVADPKESSKNYSAIYTDTLVKCLNGELSALLDAEVDGGVTIGLARPRKVAKHLEDSVPRALRMLIGKAFTINLEPDAQINSDSTWLSRVAPFPTVPSSSASTILGPSSMPPISANRGLLDSILGRVLGIPGPTDLSDIDGLRIPRGDRGSRDISTKGGG